MGGARRGRARRVSGGSARAGVSLVEALVVLTIVSVLLVLLFSVGAQGVRAGFRAGGRATAAADAGVGAESLRVLLRGLRLPVRGRDGRPFVGGPDGLTGAVVPLRSTACAAAPSPALRLELRVSQGRTQLVCPTAPGEADGRPEEGEVVLLDLGPGRAAFAYALAGRPWTDRLTAEVPRATQGGPPAPFPRLWVRLATADGRVEVVEAADLPSRAAAT